MSARLPAPGRARRAARLPAHRQAARLPRSARCCCPWRSAGALGISSLAAQGHRRAAKPGRSSWSTSRACRMTPDTAADAARRARRSRPTRSHSSQPAPSSEYYLVPSTWPAEPDDPAVVAATRPRAAVADRGARRGSRTARAKSSCCSCLAAPGLGRARRGVASQLLDARRSSRP